MQWKREARRQNIYTYIHIQQTFNYYISLLHVYWYGVLYIYILLNKTNWHEQVLILAQTQVSNKNIVYIIYMYMYNYTQQSYWNRRYTICIYKLRTYHIYCLPKSRHFVGFHYLKKNILYLTNIFVSFYRINCSGFHVRVVGGSHAVTDDGVLCPWLLATFL